MLPRLVTRLALLAFTLAFAFAGSAVAGEQPLAVDLALLAPPCEANASLAEPAALDLLDPSSALEELPLTRPSPRRRP